MDKYNYERTGGVGLKMWTKDVPVEKVAREQLHNTALMPFIFKHIAVMPDVHWGLGSTVGSVIPTKGAIIPAAVGVDIGCGMCAVNTGLTANDLPDTLKDTRIAIEKSVPHGRTNNGKPGDRGAWGNPPNYVTENYLDLERGLLKILDKHPKLIKTGSVEQRSLCHLGTLGTGNHFIEMCLDENNNVWVMLHSGSRGIGNAIGMYFINLAKEDMKKWFINLPDVNLSYFPEGTKYFEDYVEAVNWAQNFAKVNRKIMLTNVLKAISETLGKNMAISEEAINCHHNYVTKENHFGQNVWITRKGAVRAREGDLGIIPGSMGVKSYIVKGKGNPESFNTCSHGAGRAMSRTEAKRRFTVEDHTRDTEGVECRKDEDVIDETPKAYKNIDVVMAAQTDLIEVVHELKQVVCVKG